MLSWSFAPSVSFFQRVVFSTCWCLVWFIETFSVRYTKSRSDCTVCQSWNFWDPRYVKNVNFYIVNCIDVATIIKLTFLKWSFNYSNFYSKPSNVDKLYKHFYTLKITQVNNTGGQAGMPLNKKKTRITHPTLNNVIMKINRYLIVVCHLVYKLKTWIAKCYFGLVESQRWANIQTLPS